MSGPSGFSGAFLLPSTSVADLSSARRRFVQPLTMSARTRIGNESVPDSACSAVDSFLRAYRSHGRGQGWHAKRRQLALRHRAEAANSTFPQIEPREQIASRQESEAAFRLPARSNMYLEEAFEDGRMPVIAGAGGGLFFFWCAGIANADTFFVRISVKEHQEHLNGVLNLVLDSCTG